MKSEYNRIITDKNLMEERQHGSAMFPFSFYDETMSMFDFMRIDWHWHTEFEFVMVRSGSVTIWIQDAKITLSEGEAMFINSKVLHKFESDEDAVIPNILFLPTLLSPDDSLIYKSYINPIIKSDLSFMVFSPASDWQADILSLLDGIFLLSSKGTDNSIKILSHLLKLWIIFYENVSIKAAENSSAVSQLRLMQMMEYIHLHFSENIQLEDISSAAHISKSSALNQFRQILHTTPVNYLIGYRLKQASQKLARTELQINEVAHETGFENVDHFCRTFKKYYHETPGSYRNKHRLQ